MPTFAMSPWSRSGKIAYAWPALFLSLGWNFLDYGLDPPGGDDGLVWGWLVCAVLFFLMGGLPLLALWSPKVLRNTWWPPDPQPRIAGLPASGSPPSSPPPRAPSPVRTAPPVTSGDGDVVARLERLAALRDRGAIDADEYERAKKAVLDE